MATQAPPNITYQSLMKDEAATPITKSAQQQAAAPSMQERLNTYAYGTPQGPGMMQQPVPTQPLPQGVTPQQNQIDWKNFLSNPAVKAGFLQMGVNLMAGQNPGAAIGGGLAAMGRAQGITQEQEAARAAAAAKAAKGGGGGGGSSGGAARPTKLKNMTWVQFNDMIDGYLESQDPLGMGEGPIFTPGQRQQMWDRAIDVEAAGGSALGWVDVALQQGLPVAEQMYQATMAQMQGGQVPAAPAGNQPAQATPAPAAPATPAPEDEGIWQKLRNLF